MRRHGEVLMLFLLSLMVFHSEKALAGEISSAESKILAAVYEVYEYNGASYKALPEYTEQVREYLQQDDVDLSDQECEELLGMIDANLPEGIESGYFVKIEGNGTTQQPSVDGSVDHTDGDTSTEYIGRPESGKKNKDKKNPKDDKAESSEKHTSENGMEMGQEPNHETGQDSENKSGTEKNGQPETGKEETGEIFPKDNETENIDENKESSSSSENKADSPSEWKADDAEDVFAFWYQADEKRREKENNTIIMIVGVITALLVLFYAAKMIYRYYVLYLSHSKASSRWKPEHLSDLHCHLLPGVDDGSMNMAMTRNLLRMEIENGVDTILFTPHFKRGKSRFNKEKLLQVFEEVKQEALKMKPDMKLYLGEELYYDHSLCNAIEEGRALKLNGTDYVLVEFSPDVDYKTIHKACQNLVMSGVTPVLAHIERYPALFSKNDRLIEIHEMGVYYQMNITSIMGSCFSGRIYKQKKLMADGWIDIVGSDSHDDKNRNPKFKKAWKELLRLCDDEMIERIMWENPAKLLSGEDIEL